MADEDASKKASRSHGQRASGAAAAAGPGEPDQSKADQGKADQGKPSGVGAGQDQPGAGGTAQPPVVEYVVTCDAATAAVRKVEKLDAEGRRTELTPAEYQGLARLYSGTSAEQTPLQAMAADPFGMYGTPTPAALSTIYWESQTSPEAQAYYLGYAAGCAHLATLKSEP